MASFIRRALPQEIPPWDLINASRSEGPDRARRSTPALGLPRLVAQEVVVVFRAMFFEVRDSIPRRYREVTGDEWKVASHKLHTEDCKL